MLNPLGGRHSTSPIHIGSNCGALVEWGGELDPLAEWGRTFNTVRLNMVISSTQAKGKD